MHTFAYIKPRSLPHVFEVLEKYTSQARLLAGGTDLLVRLKSGRLNPEIIIDIKDIADLNIGVLQEKENLRIGAGTLMAVLEDHPVIEQLFPALAEAVHNVGSVQIRNRATIAGNLCNASPAADSAPALLIYNARINCVSPRGERILPLSDFITGPGRTALAPDELVKEILLPIPSKHQAAAFSRLTRRKGVDLATINLCCQVNRSGLTRFALGAVGPVPFIVEDSDGLLASTDVSAEDKKVRISELMEKATPITDVRASKEYRQAMLAVLGERALNTAIERLQIS